jgi:hypothetical protein
MSITYSIRHSRCSITSAWRAAQRAVRGHELRHKSTVLQLLAMPGMQTGDHSASATPACAKYPNTSPQYRHHPHTTSNPPSNPTMACQTCRASAQPAPHWSFQHGSKLAAAVAGTQHRRALQRIDSSCHPRPSFLRLPLGQPPAPGAAAPLPTKHLLVCSLPRSLQHIMSLLDTSGQCSWPLLCH